jgi:hypothetical protein
MNGSTSLWRWRSGHDDARSEADLTLSNASLGPLVDLPEFCASAQTHAWRSKPGVSAIKVRLAAGCPQPHCRSQRFDLPRDVAPSRKARSAHDPCGCGSRASGQPRSDRNRRPSTRRLRSLRGAPIDDGFERAAPRTRRSPCDPRGCRWRRRWVVGWFAATEEARLLGNVAKIMPCCNNGGGGNR